MDSDRIMLEWLNYYKKSYAIILTKRDKLSNNLYAKQEQKFKALLEGVSLIPYSIKYKESQVMLKELIATYISQKKS